MTRYFFEQRTPASNREPATAKNRMANNGAKSARTSQPGGEIIARSTLATPHTDNIMARDFKRK